MAKKAQLPLNESGDLDWDAVKRTDWGNAPRDGKPILVRFLRSVRDTAAETMENDLSHDGYVVVSCPNAFFGWRAHRDADTRDFHPANGGWSDRAFDGFVVL